MLAAKKNENSTDAEADQAADRALREAEHEEAREVQEQEQVDRVDPAQEIPESFQGLTFRVCADARPGGRAAQG